MATQAQMTPTDDSLAPKFTEAADARAASRHQFYQNIVALLQKSPLSYRNFGVYWFELKKRLKAEGFTRRMLHILGEYTDPQLSDRFDGLGEEEFLQAAIEDQQHNARYRPFQRYQTDPETDEDVAIYDEDMGA